MRNMAFECCTDDRSSDLSWTEIACAPSNVTMGRFLTAMQFASALGSSPGRNSRCKPDCWLMMAFLSIPRIERAAIQYSPQGMSLEYPRLGGGQCDMKLTKMLRTKARERRARCSVQRFRTRCLVHSGATNTISTFKSWESFPTNLSR